MCNDDSYFMLVNFAIVNKLMKIRHFFREKQILYLRIYFQKIRYVLILIEKIQVNLFTDQNLTCTEIKKL